MEQHETDLGIPRVIAQLEDRIFEGLSEEESKTFPRRFIEAVNVGADLSLVWPKFAVWLLTDEKDGVIRRAKEESTKKSIRDVSDAYQSVIDAKKVSVATWKELRAAAYATACVTGADSDYAAYAAATTCAAYAAAAADATEYAAYVYNTYDTHTHRGYYSMCANKLIQILSETK